MFSSAGLAASWRKSCSQAIALLLLARLAYGACARRACVSKSVGLHYYRRRAFIRPIATSCCNSFLTNACIQHNPLFDRERSITAHVRFVCACVCLNSSCRQLATVFRLNHRYHHHHHHQQNNNSTSSRSCNNNNNVLILKDLLLLLR